MFTYYYYLRLYDRDIHYHIDYYYYYLKMSFRSERSVVNVLQVTNIMTVFYFSHPLFTYIPF